MSKFKTYLSKILHKKYYHISQKLSSLSKRLSFFLVQQKIILSQHCYSELNILFLTKYMLISSHFTPPTPSAF